MSKVYTIVSIHSCPGQKIGLGNSGGLNIYVKNLIFYLIQKKQKVIFLSKKHENCDFKIHNKNFNLLHIDPTKKNCVPEKIIKDTNVLISNYYTSGVFSKNFFSKKKLLKINISHTLEYLKKEHFSDYKVNINRINKEKSIFEFFDYTLSFSKLENDTLRDKYGVPIKKIINSTPGFERKYFYNQKKDYARKNINVKNEDKLLLFVGRNDLLKGLDIAISGFKILEKQIKSIKLGIVGGDLGSSEQKKIENDLINSDYKDKIYWFGSVSQDNLKKYYNASDLVVIPSRSETFGIVCLEALASETHVVATNTGRMKDFIDDGRTGILLDELSPNYLSKKIVNFFENKTNFIFDDNYYKKIQKFEWQNVLDDLFQKINI